MAKQAIAINKDIFKEYDIRGRYPQELDEAAAYAIARVFVKMKKVKKLALGCDARPESAKVAKSFALGAASAGAEIFDLGVCATPELFFAVGDKHYDGGAMATASHNPAGYTGFKLCGQDGVPLGMKTGLDDLRKKIQLEIKKSGNGEIRDKDKIEKNGTIRRAGRCNNVVISDYKKFVFSFIDKKKIKNFKAVLDSSGGSGGKLAAEIFDSLAVKAIKMNFRPHDRFPDHDLNPMLEKNQKSIIAEVKKQEADLGIIWDGDADRVLFISDRGEFIPPYYVNCLLGAIVLEKFKGIKVLIDARLPVGLSQIVKKNAGRPIISRSGHTNILKAMKEKDIIFGCENSGHYFFDLYSARNGKKHYSFSDGIIPALLILEYLSKRRITILQAIKPYQEKFLISGEININNVDYQKVAAKIKNRYHGHKFSRLDGLSVFGADWFFNIRPSHTEPLIRLNIEARSINELERIKNQLMKLIK